MTSSSSPSMINIHAGKTTPTMESLKRARRRKRQRSSNGSFTTATTGCCSWTATANGWGAALTMTVLWYMYSYWPFSITTTRRYQEQQQMPGGMMKDFPTGSIDLWPNSKQNNKKQGVKLDLLWTESDEGQLRAILLKSCLPRDNVACQERRLGATSEQHVGILRPPGVFGSVFEKFVEVAIEESRRHRTTTTNAEDMEDMVIQVSPSVEMIQDYTLTQILRPTVLPILLEAIDLVLETTDIETGYTPLDTTVDDLVGTVRLLIRWHCHMAALAVDTAFLTMSLDEFLAYPVTTTKDLVQFLGWHDAPLPPDETMLKHNQKNMDELAERVFRRIDECTHHLHVLLATTTSEWLDGAVKRAIRAELQSGMCGTQRIRPDGEVIVRSRVTELVAAFLGDGSTAIPCALYPHARMCAATS